MEEDYTPDSDTGYESFERHKVALHAPLYEESKFSLSLTLYQIPSFPLYEEA